MQASCQKRCVQALSTTKLTGDYCVHELGLFIKFDTRIETVPKAGVL